jgi:hypothetical protein
MRFNIILFLMCFSLIGKAQFYTVNSLTFTNGKVSAINASGKTIFQVNCKDMVYYQEQNNTIGVFDYQTMTSRIFVNNTIISPTFANVIDSLKSWQSQCVVSGGTVIPIPLIVENIGIDTVRVIDSVRVWFERNLDTSNQAVLNSIFNLLLDSLDKQLYILNPYIDSAIVRRMDTIIDRLTTTEKLDTLKGLVYTASAKVRTNRDTLYNCKSISFGRKSTASGTLILTFENGESESFDVENDDLPAWVNGEFISYLDYNATGAVGLIVNTLGCSQTDTEICAKVKPIFDCDLVIPITCLGWQSASGVWQTLSGCWNTGQ